MKFCPYCGVPVPDAAFFCAECGKNLARFTEKTEQGEKRRKKKLKKSMKPKKPEFVQPSEEQIKAEDNYDGYYEDIMPEDADRLREGIDWNIIKRVGILVAGVFVIIGLCVVVMCLLG